MSVYNGEKYLHEAVDSILNQTFRDFEFIIIDDASTDSSLQIIENYKKNDERIKIFRKEKNKGVGGFIENLNIGIKQTKGKFIARMDQDDIAELDRFQKQISYLEAHEDVFIVGSNLQTINEEGVFGEKLLTFYTDVELQKNMYKKISLYHPVILFRNNQQVFYREKMLYCEDYDLYFRLITDNYKLANIDEYLLKYRIHNKSISRKDDKIIRWLFVEKAREFFLERQKTGKDSYEDFEPENYLNILNVEFKNSLNDLLKATKTAFKYQNYESLKAISDKGIKYYSEEKKFKYYQLYLKLPKSILPIISKLIAQ